MNNITIRSRTWANSDGTQMMQYYLDYVDHNGKRRKPKVGNKPVREDDTQAALELKAKAMAEASVIRQALNTASTTGDTTQAEAATINVLQLVDQYLSVPDREKTTKGKYMRLALSKFRASSKPLALWTEQDSMDFVQAMAKEYTHTTLPGYWRAFKRAMRYAVRSRMIDRDPTDGIEARGGRRTNPQENTLREHELKQLLQTPFRDDIRGIAFWTLRCGLYYTDFRKIYRSNMAPLEDGNYSLRWARKKTIAPSSCFITPELLEHATGDGDQLFPTMKYSQVHINNELSKWAAAAGLERNGKPLRLSHVWLRRTYGNLARRSNPDPLVIQVLLGHTDLKSQKHYVDADPQEVLEGSRAIYNTLNSISN